MYQVKEGDKIYIDIRDCNHKFTIVKNTQMEYGLLDMDELEVLNEWFSSIDNLIECLMNSCSSDKFKIETKYGETFIDAEKFKPLEVGDYVVFKSDSCSEQIIGRICENMEGDYIMTFPCDKSTDYIAYESIQEVYNFWKNTHDEAKWIRVKEKNSLVPEWDCNSKYFLFDENTGKHWIVGKESCPEIYDVETGSTLEKESSEEDLLKTIVSKYSIFEELRD